MGEGAMDRYNRNARLMPALITAIPVALVLVAAGIRLSVIGALVITPLVAMGLTHLLAQVARDRGKQMQGSLFAEWGGTPTTVRLRHSDTVINPVTKLRYHNKGAVLLRVAFPSESQEQTDPLDADRVYESFVDYLRDHTRDATQFPLVTEENINFGFRRNLLGLRFIGLPLSVIATGMTFALLFRGGTQLDQAVEWAALIVGGGFWYFWLFVCDADWVRVAADAYALRLLEASEKL